MKDLRDLVREGELQEGGATAQPKRVHFRKCFFGARIRKGQSHSQVQEVRDRDSPQDLRCVGREGPLSQLLLPYKRPRTHPGWRWPQTWLEGGKQGERMRTLVGFAVNSLNNPSGHPRKELPKPLDIKISLTHLFPGLQTSRSSPRLSGPTVSHVSAASQAWQKTCIRKCLQNE